MCIYIYIHICVFILILEIETSEESARVSDKGWLTSRKRFVFTLDGVSFYRF